MNKFQNLELRIKSCLCKFSDFWSNLHSNFEPSRFANKFSIFIKPLKLNKTQQIPALKAHQRNGYCLFQRRGSKDMSLAFRFDEETSNK